MQRDPPQEIDEQTLEFLNCVNSKFKDNMRGNSLSSQIDGRNLIEIVREVLEEMLDKQIYDDLNKNELRMKLVLVKVLEIFTKKPEQVSESNLCSAKDNMFISFEDFYQKNEDFFYSNSQEMSLASINSENCKQKSLKKKIRKFRSDKLNQ